MYEPDELQGLIASEGWNADIAGTRWSTKRYLNMELLKQRNAITA